MARDLNSHKSEAKAQISSKSRELRSNLIGDVHPVSFALQSAEARAIAEQVARSVTPNVARDYIMLARVPSNKVTAYGTYWLARYNALADIEKAVGVAENQIGNASDRAEIDAAKAAARASIADAKATYLAALDAFHQALA